MEAVYFEHRDCPYYPCHKDIAGINCLFCYCALYHKENCPGNPVWKENDGHRIKSCIDCTFPHKKENYEAVIQCLRNEDR